MASLPSDKDVKDDHLLAPSIVMERYAHASNVNFLLDGRIKIFRKSKMGGALMFTNYR